MNDPRALVYHRFRLFSFFSGLLFQLAALLVLTFSRFSQILFEAAGNNESVYFCLVFGFLTLVSFPLDYASGHVLEKKFSLSKQSFGAWLFDFFKKTFLSLLLFLVTSAGFFAAVRLWPHAWWFVLALAWFFLSAVLATLFPVFILPLFYPSRPLADAAAKERLLAWCRKLGYPAMDIHEIGFSKKTVKANAALTGFGRTRRVLLGDTLLSGFTPDEIQMVLSHEIGHHIRHHLLKGLLIDLLTALAAFYALYAASAPVARWAGVDSLADTRALPALSLLAFAANILWMPFRNTLSRRHEREADRYAWEVFPSEKTFISVMTKLAEKNLSHRSPARWEEALLADHPSIDRRIVAARMFFSRRSC